jgi:hypothetical protein
VTEDDSETGNPDIVSTLVDIGIELWKKHRAKHSKKNNASENDD